jgi:hypothetical protein
VSTAALVLAVALAIAAVVLVALPFLREPVAGDDRLDAPTEAEEQRLLLVEERDRALAALKELEFDHRTGKIGDEDYRSLLGPLRREAAAALRALDDSPAPATGTAAPMEPTTPAPVPEPYPPPDEGTIPSPAIVPEPYPPPDEATPPSLPEPSQE